MLMNKYNPPFIKEIAILIAYGLHAVTSLCCFLVSLVSNEISKISQLNVWNYI